MSFNLSNPILAGDFISLKARVKAECARRKYIGSVASYAGSSYDYSVQPTGDGLPLPEHANKIIVPLNAINDTGFSKTRSGLPVKTIESAEKLLTSLEKIAVDATDSGCKASCTGLCQGTCTETCTSGCTGECSVACGSGCSNNCTWECGGSCRTYCTEKCDEVCAFNCASDCEGTCKDGCKLQCRGTCRGDVVANPV